MEAGAEKREADAADRTQASPSPPSAGAPAIINLKRQLYLFLLPALAVVTLVTGLLGAPGSYDRLVLPMLSVVLLVTLLLVSFRWVQPRHLEAALFSVFAVTYLSKLGASLAAGTTDQIFVWTPLLYALAFLLFEPLPALLTSAGVLTASLVVTVAVAHLAPIPVRSLFEFYLANVLLVQIIYGMARLRSNVASLQRELLDMQLLAHQDILTRLPNRRALQDTLAQAIALAERRMQGVAVILFDLDDFKRVNDEHGHDAGDRILRDVATRGESVLRRPDTLGRWGGEEFLVIAPGIDLPGAMRVAERLRAALGSHPFGGVGAVTASYGVTTYHPGDTAETLLKRADDALYLAKQSGKDRVEALVRERVQHVVLPVLARPFPPLERDTDQLQRDTLTWLKDFEVAPSETLYRWVAAVQPGWLAGHMQRSNDATRLQIVSDWTFWMFLHDDHCDTSAAGRHPRYLIDLHQRLLGVLAGDAAEPQDGALATLLADLRDRLAVAGGDDAVPRFADATDRYFAATRWEAANRASNTTPDLETYERMRLLTSGLPVHTVLLETLDDVPVSDQPLAKALYAAADRAVCWANDIYSLNKEVQEEDVHNLVVALQASHHLGLDDALERAARMHDEQVARYQQLRATVDEQEGPEREALETIAQALEARMGANVAWSERCSRYRAAVTVRVEPETEAVPKASD